jgi:putative DNA primase/helicase
VLRFHAGLKHPSGGIWPMMVALVTNGADGMPVAIHRTYPAWAALSTSGLRSLDLPTNVSDVIVLADGDEAGEAAARDCGSRWKRQGRRVRIARPPQGMDFNDMLLGRAPRIEEGAQ